jgi:hypothetical protein
MINNDLSDDFEDYIIETDGHEFLNSCRVVFFRNKKNKQSLSNFIIDISTTKWTRENIDD